MAVRFDAVGDELNRTANISSNTAFTYMMWTVLDNDAGTGTYQPYVFGLSADTTQGYSCGLLSDVFRIEVYEGGVAVRNGVASGRPALGTPACIFLRCSGVGAGLLTGGYRTPAQNAFTTASATLGTLSAVTQVFYAGLFGAFWQDGRKWNVKVWDRALSDAELSAESYFERVMYPASLNLHWPLPNAGDTADRSGNGRNPTVVGTLTTGDTISNLWRPSPKIFVPQAVVNSQTIAFTLDGIASTVNQTLTHPQSLSGTLDGVTIALAQVASHSQVLAVTLDGVVAAVAQAASHPQSLAATLDGVGVSIAQVVGSGNSQALSITLDGIAAAVAQVSTHPQSLSATLDDVVVAISQGARHAQTLAATLDGVAVEINQSAASPQKDQALALTLDDITVTVIQTNPDGVVLLGGGPGGPRKKKKRVTRTELDKDSYLYRLLSPDVREKVTPEAAEVIEAKAVEVVEQRAKPSPRAVRVAIEDEGLAYRQAYKEIYLELIGEIRRAQADEEEEEEAIAMALIL